MQLIQHPINENKVSRYERKVLWYSPIQITDTFEKIIHLPEYFERGEKYYPTKRESTIKNYFWIFFLFEIGKDKVILCSFKGLTCDHSYGDAIVKKIKKFLSKNKNIEIIGKWKNGQYFSIDRIQFPDTSRIREPVTKLISLILWACSVFLIIQLFGAKEYRMMLKLIVIFLASTFTLVKIEELWSWNPMFSEPEGDENTRVFQNSTLDEVLKEVKSLSGSDLISKQTKFINTEKLEEKDSLMKKIWENKLTG